MLLLILFSVFSIQCSKSMDDTEQIPIQPPRPYAENPDSSTDPHTGEVKFAPTFYAEGFATGSNAQLIVDSLAADVAPQFQDLVSWLEGSSADRWGSKVTRIFMHDNGSVYVEVPRFWGFSLLFVDDGWGGSYIYYWDLEYVITQIDGQPDEITITGSGKGSHIYQITSEAWLASEIDFDFKGVQIEGTNNFQGTFTLDEKSPDETYNLLLSGTLTLNRDPERD